MFTYLEVIEAYDCKKQVFSFFAIVYGPNNPHPYQENMPVIQSVFHYCWTEVMIERILMDYCTSKPDFCAVLLRCFNIIISHASGLLGDDPNNLMTYIAVLLPDRWRKLTIFDDDYPTRMTPASAIICMWSICSAWNSAKNT